MDDLLLPLDAFVRAIGINRGARHAFFLGAGASITSGVPSAQSCIWEWKRDIFLTNNPGLEGQFSELSLAGVRQRIQKWLDHRGGYPPERADDEYGFYIEACYPKSPENRRQYFQEKSRTATPHVGYQLLCLLAETGLISSVWTTNFDGLVGRAAANFKLAPVEVGIDCQHRAVRAMRNGELLVVSLHGDYRYDKLKNTKPELQSQEQTLRESLIRECENTSLIISGYSGRDNSVMEALSASFGAKGTGVLYWCVHDIDDIPPTARELVTLARRNNRQAFLVAGEGFDNVMVRLALHCLDEEQRGRAATIISQGQGNADLQLKPFQIDRLPIASIVKSNAFELTCPSEVFTFGIQKWPEEHVWKWVKEQVGKHEVVAVPFKGKILAIGTIDDIKTCFGGNIEGEILRVPIADKEFRYEDGAIVSLMREALVRSMVATKSEVKSDGEGEIWFSAAEKKGRVGDIDYLAFGSVLLFIRHFLGRQYLILKPSVKVLTPAGEKLDKNITNPIKLGMLGWQHNREFNEAVNNWRGKLLSTERDQTQVEYEFPVNCGSTFRFTIRRSPVFAAVGREQSNSGIEIAKKFEPLMKQAGIELIEPKLIFANKSGNGTIQAVHPVRGIVMNRPFDYALTQKGLASTLRLGVICPKAEERLLQAYLQQAKQTHKPGKYESEYLPTFPGFDAAFGLSLEIPEPGSSGWVTCGEPPDVSDQKVRSIETGKNINHALNALTASFTPNVVLIFFPERWATCRGFSTETEKFDTHDFVKAYSVQHGISTQFLNQETFKDETQCRVWWWLSLAFYVKSMRTPWVLDGLDESTAFVGLGFSVKHAVEKRRHIVLGCSHIYSARGIGLQYRLSKIENPVFFGGNPFLSREDARQVGERIRELFFESRSKLPDRVVIHKRTPFRFDERVGLREGLSGVANIEMLEIYVDESLRYVASSVNSRGELDADGYPVKRCTTVKLDDRSALLWVHGASLEVSTNARRPYFQGKRRIPAPIILRRHAGNSDLRMVAEEILGLSKMNWNTFDFYTKLPATVHSSNEIARIGSLLERFGANSYDFRLFI
jgi:SIR2-like domain